MVLLTIATSDCTPQTIVIGRRGTYETMQIAFDLSYLVQSYGNGVAVLAVKRSQDAAAYPATITQDGNTLTWTVSETDTYYVGAGECQLMWYVNNGLAKTIIYPVVVMRDILSTAEEPPDGYENWVESLTELGAETLQNAQEAAQSATEAEASAEAAAESEEKAKDAADLLENVSATATTLEPGQPATAEYDDGIFKFGIPKGDKLTYADLTEADKEDLVQGPIKEAQDDAVEAVGTAKTNAVEAVNTAGTTQKNAVNEAGTTQKNAVNQAGTSAVNAVNQAGETQVDNVQTEGAIQVQAVEDKGDEVIDSIPSDYSDLTAEVDNLSRQLNDETTGLDSKAPVILETVSGAIASFDDGADSMPIRKLVATIEPVQDLHGYDSPWPAGGGANKFGGDALKTALLTVTGATEGSDANGNYVNLPASGALNNVILFSDFEENQQYTIIFKILPTGSHASNIRVYYTDNTAQTFSTSGDGQLETVSYTTAAGKTVESIRLGYWYTSTCKVYYDSCGVFVGADQTFAPYENLCPISGWTGAEIEQTGKNLLDITSNYIEQGRITGSGEEVSATNRVRTHGFISVKESTQYTVSANGVDRVVVYEYKDNGTINYVNNVLNTMPHTFTAKSGTNKLRLVFGLASGADITPSVVSNVQLEVGSTATTYHPYTGNQVSVTFPETIYGGEDEVISGKLKSTMGMVDLGTLNWQINDIDHHRFLSPNIAGMKLAEVRQIKILCDTYKSNVGTNPWEDFSIYNYNSDSRLFVVDSRFSDAAQLKNALAGVYAVFPLEQPTEYSLTQQTVETLYGTNNIWSSTGDTEVTYPADTKLYIEKLTQPEEDDMTANANIAANTFFMIGNTLYFSTAAIAQGATIIPGTNCNVVSLADALNRLNT